MNVTMNPSRARFLTLAMLTIAAAMLMSATSASAQCPSYLQLTAGPVPSEPVFRELYDKVLERPWVYDELGCPSSDYGHARDGGAFVKFERGAFYLQRMGGLISTPRGAIYDKWASLGYEWGPAGYPGGKEGDFPGGGRQLWFENGKILWHPSHGAFHIHGDIFNAFMETHAWEFAGYPISDEEDGAGTRCGRGNRVQSFANMWACWNSQTREVSWNIDLPVGL